MKLRGRAWLVMVLSVALLITTGETAHAQLIASKGAVSPGEVHYVAVREGQRTVLYLSVSVDDAAKGDFSVVVPVTSPKGEARIATSSEMARFSQLQALAAPRLIEYWEQDPCEFHTGGPDDGIAERDVSGDAKPAAPPADSVEATITSAKTLAEVTAALGEHAWPAGAEALMKGYASAGASFIVATAKKNERVIALRWEVDQAKLTIPVRLLAAHGESAPLVSIDVISGGDRFEAANRPNLAAPANTNVKWGVKGSTDTFHDAVLMKLLSTRQDAVVTQYAWSATSCAPCPGPPLNAASLADLGVGASASAIHEVMIFTDGKIAKKPDGPPALRKALMACYGKVLAAEKASTGEVTVKIDVTGGKVSSAKTSADGASEALQRCAEDSVKATPFDGSGTSGSVRVQFMPMSRKFVSDFVLTRLRARIGEGNETDLELRPGAPIAGGDEVGPTGGPKVGAYAAPKANHFQSRYTVRHKWAGKKATCLNPSPGKWGAPPAGVTPKPAGKRLVAAKAKVEDLVEGDLAAADALTMRFPPRNPSPATTSPPTPVATAIPSAAPSASAGAASPAAPPQLPSQDAPEKRWIGLLALAVCGVALYLAQRAQA